jgi:hypothetical protein
MTVNPKSLKNLRRLTPEDIAKGKEVSRLKRLGFYDPLKALRKAMLKGKPGGCSLNRAIYCIDRLTDEIVDKMSTGEFKTLSEVITAQKQLLEIVKIMSKCMETGEPPTKGGNININISGGKVEKMAETIDMDKLREQVIDATT